MMGMTELRSVATCVADSLCLNLCEIQSDNIEWVLGTGLQLLLTLGHRQPICLFITLFMTWMLMTELKQAAHIGPAKWARRTKREKGPSGPERPTTGHPKGPQEPTWIRRAQRRHPCFSCRVICDCAKRPQTSYPFPADHVGQDVLYLRCFVSTKQIKQTPRRN
jgi:hypothetical protein